MKSLPWFIDKKLFLKDETIKNLAKGYFEKARNNIITMEILNKVRNFSELLAIPKTYNSDEWVVITAYYSMYMAALSILAKLGYKSKNHTATIVALEEFFVKKNLLEKEYLGILEKIKIKKEEIEELEKIRNRREIAQYSITKETTRVLAEETMKDAHRFINRLEELFDLLE